MECDRHMAYLGNAPRGTEQERSPVRLADCYPALKTRYEVMSRAADEWSIAPPSRSVPFREVSGNHRRSVAAWGHHRDKLRQASPLACDDKAWAAEQSARSSAKENAAWAASSPRSYPYP